MSEALEKLEEAIATAPDGVVKAYLTRDPKGRKSTLPAFEVRRDEPFEDQLWEHVLAHATEGGPFEVRLRVDGRHLAQDLVPLEFKRGEGRAPNPPPAAAPVSATSGLLEELRRMKELKLAMRELEELDEPDDQDEDEDDDDEFEDDEDGADEEDREPNPGPEAGAVAGLLADEDVKKGLAGLFLQVGDWLAKDAALKEAQAAQMRGGSSASASSAEASDGETGKGKLVGRGASADRPRPRLVAVTSPASAEEGEERAAGAGDAS